MPNHELKIKLLNEFKNHLSPTTDLSCSKYNNINAVINEIKDLFSTRSRMLLWGCSLMHLVIWCKKKCPASLRSINYAAVVITFLLLESIHFQAKSTTTDATTATAAGLLRLSSNFSGILISLILMFKVILLSNVQALLRHTSIL